MRYDKHPQVMSLHSASVGAEDWKLKTTEKIIVFIYPVMVFTNQRDTVADKVTALRLYHKMIKTA